MSASIHEENAAEERESFTTERATNARRRLLRETDGADNALSDDRRHRRRDHLDQDDGMLQ